MALCKDLEDAVDKIYAGQWSTRDGQVVPEPNSLTLGNEAVKLDATVLYADMADSTLLVDNYPSWYAAEVYKTFLFCAAKIIKSEGGTITAYDGDRVMAVFIGESKNTNATRAGLKINWCVFHILRPRLAQKYPDHKFVLKHVTGIDTSPLFVTRTGVRGDNDLVWVGRAANHAAKMSSLPDTYQTRISKSVYDSLHGSLKMSGTNPMWDSVTWSDMGLIIYRSTWKWRVD